MDRITDQERTLIDAAIDAGRVTVCPPRTHATGEMIYDPATKRVRYTDPADAKAAMSTKWASSNRTGRKADPRVAARRARIKALAEDGKSRAEILEIIKAEGFAVTANSMNADLYNMGVRTTRRSAMGKVDKTAALKADRAERKRAKLRDRRRFKTGAPAGGEYSTEAPAGAEGTIFPARVSDPGDEALLKDGSNSVKIGGDVLVGHLKGARILTLTLEERATCPKTCAHWRGCYGNAMPHSIRWRHGPELIARLGREVAALCAEHDTVLIRLHILGDFWSSDYVWFWAGCLASFDNLHIFGFTAWPEATEIGAAIVEVRSNWPRRFMIRNSGRTGIWGSFDITDPFPEKTIGDAIVCPEQRLTNLGPTKRHCGNCAACWSTDKPIAFIRH